MKIAIASGKGGTGKTLVATSLAVSVAEHEPVTLLDCDVEEPDAALLLLKPTMYHRREVKVPVPFVHENACSGCGKCADICAFHAIAVAGQHILTFPELCHGCGACAWACTEHAIDEVPRVCGLVAWGRAGNVTFVQGRLTVGEAMPGPVIRAVKARAGAGNVIVDCPPGTSCPMVEAVRGCDYCLLVTEPTPFGLHDLKLAVSTVRQLGIPCGAVINRSTGDDTIITGYLREQRVPLLLTIPLDREIARQYAQGITLAWGVPVWRASLAKLWETMREMTDERARCPQR